MKKYLVTAISTIFLAVAASSSQTPNSLSQKHGPPDEKGRYTIRPGIGLEATYDSDGKPLAMTLNFWMMELGRTQIDRNSAKQCVDVLR